MRKIIDLLSITVLVASPVALGMVYAQTSASQAVVQPIEVITDKNFPLNRPQTVNFEPNEGFYKLTKRQKDDQLRDWLLMTALSGKGLSSEKISQGVYDLPAVRYDFISPVANFEYGSTRSRYVGDGKIVALVPNTTSKEQRMDDLAHIADRHRKDQGEKPKIIEVFEYEIAPDKQSSFITRKETINSEQLFSSAYGYSEITINNQNDLQSFLNQVDDITFAQVNGSSLTVGGRKIYKDKDNRKHQNLRVEDIAALWQSDFNNINGSLFSLDLEYDYPRILQALEKATPLLNKLELDGKPVISDRDIKQAKQGLSHQDKEPYFDLIAKLKKFWMSNYLVNKVFNEGEIAAEVEKELKIYRDNEYKASQDSIKNFKEKHYKEIQLAYESGLTTEKINSKVIDIENKEQKYENEWNQYLEKEIPRKKNEIIYNKQKPIDNLLDAEQKKGFMIARYDGNLQEKKAGLQGTEVGMTLFYTDLLMKILNFNFQNSTVETAIEDFKPTTRIPISSIYKSELKQFQYSRLWLEPNDKGFQVANEDKDLIFAPNATQIKAASSDRPQSDKETNARPDTTAFLNWWNNHYEEVARYEPQYERLNQIMKWSLVINWLNQHQQNELYLQYQQSNPLSFLQPLKVKRDNWFPDWVRSQGKQLKFRKWDKITFLSEGYNYKGRKTEKLKFLESENIDKKYGKPYPSLYGGVSLAGEKNFEGRISLPKDSKIGNLGRSNIDYKSVKFQRGKLEFKTLDGTKYRVRPLSKTVSETIVEPKPEAKLRSPNAELTNQPFSSKVTQIPDGLKLENAIGDTEFGNLNISKTANGFKVGFESRDIDAGYSLASRLSVGTSRLNPKKVSVLDALREMDDVVFVRYSPSQPNDYFVQLSKSNNKWLKFSEQPLADGSGGGAKPPSKRIMSVAEPEDGARNFNFESLNEGQVSQQTQGFQQFSGKRANYKSSYNYRKEAQKLAAEPVKYLLKQKLDLQFRIKNIDVELKAGNYTRAAKSINESIKLHGSEPNLMLRKAAVNVHEGRLKVERITPEGVKPFKQNFFDEINNRNFKVIENNTEFIYVQDSPGLNNLQFKQSISQSVPFGSGARFYKLQPGEIGRVKIRQSGLGDVSVSSNPSTKTTGSNVGDSLRFQFQNSPQRFVTNNECQENDESDKNQNTNKCSLEKPVYVVTTSEKN
ncbi:hypothetical protein H1Q63_03140 [Desmonostoc muscorum CCALA 125]|nr:hypothetical protein [Desmonostoc muscorum CCALA 125]